MPSKHTLTHFDTELEAIRKRLLEMGGLVAQQLSRAIDALGSGDMATIEAVIEDDRRVNEEEVALDDACIQLIARHGPTAGDLRMVMTMIQMITDLERVGDEAKKIAKAGKQIIGSEVIFVPKVELRHVAAMVVDMLQRALDAFARMDPSSSADIARQDKEVDAIFKGIMRQLITYMMEDPRLITRALDVLFIAKSIERVGDHAKNVSEYVVYMVRGRDVRHEGIEALERESGRR
ncbi:phosphate signaling complex protein PhoU [Aromatoleum anaerobium]|uniref:Phosphate-specific transport system accessory protein PhoU n=1 Tax=Aromatoleum anaerobium TaxID=182180 RepID=A0ABX1PIG5_9RHOO|nr:phosphate signaling complex protein PhoU [Aromatoleum anaerobium]MCK0506927.1 phosphate signaling complex protein PhoU [Aromatoleum anaerobium]